MYNENKLVEEKEEYVDLTELMKYPSSSKLNVHHFHNLFNLPAPTTSQLNATKKKKKRKKKELEQQLENAAQKHRNDLVSAGRWVSVQHQNDSTLFDAGHRDDPFYVPTLQCTTQLGLNWELHHL